MRKLERERERNIVLTLLSLENSPQITVTMGPVIPGTRLQYCHLPLKKIVQSPHAGTKSHISLLRKCNNTFILTNKMYTDVCKEALLLSQQF